MNVSSPSLAPIFRSSAQGRILATLMLSPSREWTIRELADRAGADSATVSREISRAEKAGIVRSRPAGSARLVSPNQQARHYGAISELILAAFGPPEVLRAEFESIDGIEELILFGSWAAREAGEDGPPPQDVDLLVVGDVDRSAIYRAADRSEKRLGMEVNVTVRTPEVWGSNDPFVEEVRSRPYMNIGTGQSDYEGMSS